MLPEQVLTDILFAIATGYVDRAVQIVTQLETTDDETRGLLLAALAQPTREGQARGLGDVLRSGGFPRQQVNECYRAAFYASDASLHLSTNPLFAFFVANRSGRQLDKWPHYFPVYHRHLAPFRERAVKVLEIGVYRGGGLAMLRHYLGAAAHVVGIDIDTAAVRAAEGYTVELGDQEDVEFLREVSRRHGPWDIVIDDGGHRMRQQIASVETLFPELSDGGVYVVEDCHTSYWAEYADPDEPTTFLDWVRDRIDDLNAYHRSGELGLLSPWATSLDGVHLYDSIVVLDKSARFAPFGEITGASEYLYFGRDPLLATNEMRAARDQSIDARAAMAADLDQLRAQQAEAVNDLTALRPALEAMTVEISQVKEALARTQDELAGSRALVDDMRTSTSWRATEPLRRIRALVDRA